MTWLEFKRKDRETTSRLTSEAVKWAKEKAEYIARHYRTPLSLTGNIVELLAYLNAALDATEQEGGAK